MQHSTRENFAVLMECGCKYSTGKVLSREYGACWLAGVCNLGLEGTDQLEMCLKCALEQEMCALKWSRSAGWTVKSPHIRKGGSVTREATLCLLPKKMLWQNGQSWTGYGWWPSWVGGGVMGNSLQSFVDRLQTTLRLNQERVVIWGILKSGGKRYKRWNLMQRRR